MTVIRMVQYSPISSSMASAQRRRNWIVSDSQNEHPREDAVLRRPGSRGWTKRQLAGFAITLFSTLGLMFVYWLAPVFNLDSPRWVFWVIGAICMAWGLYFPSQFARRD